MLNTRTMSRRAAVATCLCALAATTAGFPSALLVASVHLEGAQTKKPIYDDELSACEVVARPPTRVEMAFRELRALTALGFKGTMSSLQSVVNSWIRVERRAADTIGNLRAEDERLIPAGLYILVTAFSGSILARNRSIPLRLLTPPLFFAAASTYFLPYTSANIYNSVFRALPSDAQQRILAVKDSSEVTITQVQDSVKKIQDKAREITANIKENTDSVISNVTGALQSRSGEPPQQRGVITSKNTEINAAKPTTAQVVEKLEAMYTTRGDPGVREVIVNDRQKQDEH